MESEGNGSGWLARTGTVSAGALGCCAGCAEIAGSSIIESPAGCGAAVDVVRPVVERRAGSSTAESKDPVADWADGPRCDDDAESAGGRLSVREGVPGLASGPSVPSDVMVVRTIIEAPRGAGGEEYTNGVIQLRPPAPAPAPRRTRSEKASLGPSKKPPSICLYFSGTGTLQFRKFRCLFRPVPIAWILLKSAVFTGTLTMSWCSGSGCEASDVPGVFFNTGTD